VGAQRQIFLEKSPDSHLAVGLTCTIDGVSLLITMSLYRTVVTLANPRNTAQVAGPIDALVDTGSELSWFPEGLLDAGGIVRLRKRNFVTATGQHITRDIGYAIVRAEQFETIDEVVFGQPGDMTLLGVRTLEGFGVMVDNLGRRLVATTTVAA